MGNCLLSERAKEVREFFEKEQSSYDIQIKSLENNIDNIQGVIEKKEPLLKKEREEVESMFKIEKPDEKAIKAKISDLKTKESEMSRLQKQKTETEENMKQLKEAQQKFNSEVNKNGDKRTELIEKAMKEIDEPENNSEPSKQPKSSSTLYFKEFKKAKAFLSNNPILHLEKSANGKITTSTTIPSQVEIDEAYCQMKDDHEVWKQLEELKNVPKTNPPVIVAEPSPVKTTPVTSHLGKLIMAI